jgi:apolipoprotein N-acyltransferase
MAEGAADQALKPAVTITRASVLRIGAGLVLALLTVPLLLAAFPPLGWWPLVWVAFVPMLVAQHRVLSSRHAGLGVAAGLGGAYLAGTAMLLHDVAPAPYFWLIILGLLVVLIPVGRLMRNRAEANGYRRFVLAVPVVITAVELLRSFTPMSTWGYSAYALYSEPWLIQPVSVFGTLGLVLLIFVVNWAVALAALAVIDRASSRFRGEVPVTWLRARWQVAGAGLALMTWIALSLVLLHPAPATVRVAAVQPGLVSYRKFFSGPGVGTPVASGRPDENLTRAAAAQGAQLVVWPEGDRYVDPRQAGGSLGQMASSNHIYLVVGSTWGRTGDRNEASVFSPDGTYLGSYNKHHPVVWLGEHADASGDYPVYQTPFGALSTIICYDLDFLDSARQAAQGGARIVAVPSSDWGSIASQHYGNLVFRAVENRLTMVKADHAYDSAIIDPYGRVVTRAVTPGGESRLLVADVPVGSGDSLAVKFGNWAGWLCIPGALLLIFWRPHRPKRP